VGNKITCTIFTVCPPRRLSFELTTVFQYVRYDREGKDSSSHRCRWGFVVNATIRTLYNPGMTHNPLYSRLGVSKGRAGRVRKLSPNPRWILGTFSP